MMMFVWMCVMAASFIPGGARFVEMQAAAVEAQINADFEAEEIVRPGAAIGAAQNFVRFAPPGWALLR